jgi:MtN3 and saliva related transmembrane protein
LSSGEILGLVAGAITTGSFVPQVVRVYRIRSAREISLFFTILFLVGDLIWMAYGIYLEELPIILWNILGASLAGALMVAKFKYGKISSTKETLEAGRAG